jgi:type II secretory pathway pseudopilin PulG
MKQYLNIKKYMAFTLTEMTMVILIMSIVAAISTPVITKNIKNVETKKKQLDATPTISPLWKQAESADGAYYISPYATGSNAGMVAINIKPNTNRNTYFNPAMVIGNPASADSIENNDISKIGQMDFYNGAEPKRRRIAMDESHNILMGYGNLYRSGDEQTNTLQNSIIIGNDNLHFQNKARTNMHDGIIIGNGIHKSSGDKLLNLNRTISIGYGISKPTLTEETQFVDTVQMGYCTSYNSKTNFNSVLIGSYAGSNASGNSSNNIAIGSYAGYGNNSVSNISIGMYSGHSDNSNGDNISIGYFTNYKPISSTSTSITAKAYSNISIGEYANTLTVENTKVSFLNTAIGSYAGYGKNVKVAYGNLIIGYYANTKNNTSNYQNIVIGHQAGVDWESAGYKESDDTYGGPQTQRAFYGTIAIGPFSANSLYEGSGIYIGNQAGKYGSYNKKADNIIIGTSAGISSTAGAANGVKGSIFIGKNAGNNSNGIFEMGIGQDACQHTGKGKVCIGPQFENNTSLSDKFGSYVSGRTNKSGHSIHFYTNSDNSEKYNTLNSLPSELLYTSYYPFVPEEKSCVDNTGNLQTDFSGTIGIPHCTTGMAPLWNPVDGKSVIVLNPGPMSSSNPSSITLFAPVVYSLNARMIPFVFSDRRLKENIIPYKYSLKELEKLNVYNFNWKTGDTTTPQISYISQEVKSVIPEAVSRDENGYYRLDGSWILYTAVNAIKELDTKIQKLDIKVKTFINGYFGLVSKIETLEKQAKAIKAENEAIKNRLEKLEN